MQNQNSLVEEMYEANKGIPAVRRDEDLIDTIQRMRRRMEHLEVAQEKLRIVFYEERSLGERLRSAIKDILDV